MTSVARVTAHPQPGIRAGVTVQDYKDGEVTNEETAFLTAGEVREFAFYPGRQITFFEQTEESGDDKTECG